MAGVVLDVSRQAPQAGLPAEVSLKPRAAAVARDTAEVVRFAGGWLFDKAMGGWDVNVLTLDGGDLRSLRILGVHPHNLAPVLESRVTLGQCLRVIAIPEELYWSEPGFRKIVGVALEPQGELLLWGDGASAALDQYPSIYPRRAPVPVLHRLSFAARAFKAHALAATQIQDPDAVVIDSESFRSVTVSRVGS